MENLEDFFRTFDQRWGGTRDPRIELRVLGSTALMLQSDYIRGTNDGDVLETASISGETKERLLALGGKGSPLHLRHGLYLDVVPNGLPFLPHGPRWHPLPALNGSLRVFAVMVLDIVDVVVSKTKRFSANDQSDVQAMIDRDQVPHDRLVERFRSAVDVFSGDARAEDLPRYVRNLHRIERDMLGVGESEIELPGWIDDA
ncbi:MAG: DUF6036 family nucleotidyltransferase [Byssovorax sp.]